MWVTAASFQQLSPLARPLYHHTQSPNVVLGKSLRLRMKAGGLQAVGEYLVENAEGDTVDAASSVDVPA